jgi:hypothetical protein
MRTQAARALDTTCTLQTATRTSDGLGGFTISWSTAASNVACRLSPLTMKALAGSQGEQFTVVSAWVLHLGHGQAVTAGQRAVVGGDTYEVLNVEDDQSERASRRAYLRRIE